MKNEELIAKVAKATADRIGNGMSEKYEAHAEAAIEALRSQAGAVPEQADGPTPGPVEWPANWVDQHVVPKTLHQPVSVPLEVLIRTEFELTHSERGGDYDTKILGILREIISHAHTLPPAAPTSPAADEPDVAAFVECAWSVLMHDIDPEGTDEATVANIAVLKDGFGKLLRRVKRKPAPAADERVRQSGLAIDRSDGLLRISIGEDALLHAIRYSPYFARIDPEDRAVFTDKDAFVKEIVRALECEEEDGTTLVHRCLDKAAEWAVEQGGEGLDLEPTALAARKADGNGGEG